MSEQKLLKLTNDYVFKRTFGYAGDEEVTKIFLRDILQTEVTKVELDKNTITEKDLLDDKVGIMDIKASINNNIECDIEMQVVNQKDIEKRILYYWSKIYSKTIKEGNGYETLKKSIVVLIADFKFDKFKNIEKYITKWNIREEEYSKVILTDVLEIYIIELEKFSKLTESRANKNLNFWIKFIKNPGVIYMSEKNKEEKSIKETKRAIDKAKEKLEKLSKDEHERYLADLREKYIRDQYSIEAYGYDRGKADGYNIGKADGYGMGKADGYDVGKADGYDVGKADGYGIGKTDGIEQGRADGIKEKAITIAKKMLEQKADIEFIETCTGLTKEEIENLK